MTARIVVHMRDQRPVWAMPPWALEEIRAAAGSAWEVLAPDVPADGSGDGRGGVPPEVLDAVREAEVYMGFGVPAEILRAGEGLRWVHSGAAGVGGSLTPEMRSSSVRFTNSAGIHAAPMAETVVAMILHFARGLDFAERGRERGEWWPDPFLDANTPVRELAGATVGILGYGGIGRAVATRLVPLGASVLGLKRRPPGPGDDEIELVGRPVRIPGAVALVTGEEGLERLLGESDYLVLAAPETGETRGIVDRTALSRMKAGAVVVNVARGRLVDVDALMDAVEEGRLRGVALDVFPREPLPPDHRAWDLPRTLLTPHVSAVTRGYWRREVDLVVENLRRFREGEPLRNEVDKAAGY